MAYCTVTWNAYQKRIEDRIDQKVMHRERHAISSQNLEDHLKQRSAYCNMCAVRRAIFLRTTVLQQRSMTTVPSTSREI